MRVDFTNLGLEPPDKNKTARSSQNGTAANAAAVNANSANDVSDATDQARLSFSQARVQSLEAGVLSAPEVRQQKVASLEQAVSSGNYTVDPVQVANAIVGELGNVQPR